jgi:hypothetical protein
VEVVEQRPAAAVAFLESVQFRVDRVGEILPEVVPGDDAGGGPEGGAGLAAAVRGAVEEANAAVFQLGQDICLL